MLCWNCVARKVFLHVFLNNNFMLLDCFSGCDSGSHAYCVPFTTSPKKKYLVSLWQAKHLICADWCRQVICRFTHAELQALWKNYIGRIWDLCPSPNAIHVLGCSYWAPPMGTDSCTQHTGNILKRAVKKIEQSSPSREKNRWVGTWQWWPAGGCFW